MDCSTSPNASHFLRKLQNSEMAILEQISIHKSTSIFKAKLIELEEFLQNSHRQRHLSLTSPNSNSSSPLSIDLTAPRFGHKPSLPQFPDSHCFNVLFGPITKNNIGNHLKKAFEQLDDIPGYSSLSDSAAYIDGMQKLLAAVAKSIKTFLPFLNEDQLLLKVSGYAIAKIPKEKQIEFNARYDRKSLLNLMRFLRKEILIFYENFTDKRARAVKSVGKPSLDNIGEKRDADAIVELYCVYCRDDGHTVHECPIKRNMLCFKCYEFGHTLKCCPNGRVHVINS